jgi:hypothetical protein
MILQALDAAAPDRFSMVHFGNVLGSSGSVVPCSASRSPRRTGDHHPSGRHPLFHDHPGGCAAGAPGRRDGPWRRVFASTWASSPGLRPGREHDRCRASASRRASPDGDIEPPRSCVPAKLYEELLIGEDLVRPSISESCRPMRVHLPHEVLSSGWRRWPRRSTPAASAWRSKCSSKRRNMLRVVIVLVAIFARDAGLRWNAHLPRCPAVRRAGASCRTEGQRRGLTVEIGVIGGECGQLAKQAVRRLLRPVPSRPGARPGECRELR